MEREISVSIGEIILKGKNRKYFVDRLVDQIKIAIEDIGYEKLYKDQGKIYIKADENNYPEMINRLKNVFGLVYISTCIKVDKDFDEIKKASVELMKEKIDKDGPKTFKVETNRVDKSYPVKSPEVSRIIGGEILKNIDIKVDVHNPETYLYIDIRGYAYIYTDRIEGARGMPNSTNGRGLVLLSGGIDSPVAAYLMASRGVNITALHFHSYPFTNKRAEDKVKDLARILTRYIGNITLYSVNILDIQKALNKNTPEEEMTILSRRFMMRIAEKICKKDNIQGIITGEAIGQVASQTMEGLIAIEDATNIPILRPLIAFDKIDIIAIAKKIGTYDTSIIPLKDSCTVFLPKNPLIKPRIRDLERSEEKLDIEGLVNSAIENMEVFKI